MVTSNGWVRTFGSRAILPLLALMAAPSGGCFASHLGGGAHVGEHGARPDITFEGGTGFAHRRFAVAATAGYAFTTGGVEGAESVYSVASGMVTVPVTTFSSKKLPLWGVMRGTWGWQGHNAEEPWQMEKGSVGIALAGHGPSQVAGNRLGGNFGGVEIGLEVARQHGRLPGNDDEENLWSAGLTLKLIGIGQVGDVILALIEGEDDD